MSFKVVTAKARVERRRRSAGLSIAQLNTEHLPHHLDPFLAFDHFEMAEPLRASERGAHVVLAGGTPLHEPTVLHGPFCMNTREDIVRAVRDYEAGKMGHLAPCF